MRFKKQLNQEKGFFVLLLDILFVAVGIAFLIYGLLNNKEIVASLISIFQK